MHELQLGNSAWRRLSASIACVALLLGLAVSAYAQNNQPYYPLDYVNPSNSNFGGVNYSPELYNNLNLEAANRWYEQCPGNQVSVTVNASACLGSTGAGLTMTPTACVAYNQGLRMTETGSITFPNSSTCWVAVDPNTSGTNAGLPAFSRVSGTHYLIDCAGGGEPSAPANAQMLMEVVTSGGSITSVTDVRKTSASCGGSGSGGVTQLVAGTNITLNPPNGLGTVTINASNGSSTTPGLPFGSPQFNSSGTFAGATNIAMTVNAITGIGVSGLNDISDFNVNGQINVQTYGAACNGSTDDTGAIQAAFTAACASSPHPEIYFPYTGHSCYHTQPIHVPCAPLSVHGPMQGRTAALSQNYVGPALLAQTAGASTLQLGSALVGSGNSLNLGSYVANSDGVVSYNPLLNSGYASMNGLSSFDVEYVYKISATNGGSQEPLLGSSVTTQASDHGASAPVFQTYLDNSDVLHASVNVSTSGNVSLPTSNQSTNTCYDVAIDKNGASCRLFVNGSQVGSTTTCTGTAVMDPYEVVTAPSMQVGRWPLAGYLNAPPTGFIDTIRVEKASVHTSNYTSLCSSNTKQTADSNTMLLDNFVSPTTQQEDTDPVIVGNNTSANAYLPIKAYSISQIFGLHLAYLEMCPDANTGETGLWDQATPQGEFDHLFCSHNAYTGLDFEQNTFESFVHDNNILGGSVCINYGPGFSEGSVGNNLCSQGDQSTLHTCYNVDSSSFVSVYDQCQDVDNPGDIIYPHIEYSAHDTWLFPFLDAEFGNSTVMDASFGLVHGNYANETIVNAEGNTRNNAPLVVQNGGAPIKIDGLDWASQPASQIIGFISPPSGPDLIENSILPSNGNAFCTGSATPLACCTGSDAGTCTSPVPLSTSQPTFVDSLDNVYDDSLPATNLFNGGLTVPSLISGITVVGTPGFTCISGNTANNASLSIAKPTCSQPGVVEVCVVGAQGTPSLTLSGWTQIGSTTHDSGSNSEAAAWWRSAPVGEGSTISITGASGNITGQCGVATGVDPIVPIDTSNTGSTAFTSNASVTAPSLTPASTNDPVLTFAEFNSTGGGTYSQSGAPSSATLFSLNASSTPLFGSFWGPAGASSAAVTYSTTGTSASAVAFAIAFHPISLTGPGLAVPQSPTDFIAGSLRGFASASIAGGGALATGSNSLFGTITGMAATSNVLTPGFTCPNAVVCSCTDDTTAGGCKKTASNATTITWSATASDTVDYACGCR